MTKQKHLITMPLLLVLTCVLTLALAFGVYAADAAAPRTQTTQVTFCTDVCAGAPGGHVSTTLYVDEGSALMDFQIALSFSDVLVSTLDAVPLVDNLTVEVSGKVVYITFTNVEENLAQKTELVRFDMTLKGNITPSEIDADTGLSQAYPFLSFEPNYHASSAEANTMDEDLTFRSLTITDNFGGVSVYAYGDVNQSGHISINDVTVLRQYLVDMRTLDDAQLSIANVYIEDAEGGENADDAGLSIFDAALIQKSLTTTGVQLSPLPEDETANPVTPPVNAGTPDDGNEDNSTSNDSVQTPETCTHATQRKTVTETPDVCHTYTIVRDVCACGEVCTDVSFISECNFDGGEQAPDQTMSWNAMSGNGTLSVCSDCHLFRRVASIEGANNDVYAYATLTEYGIVNEDGSYTLLCSILSNYREEQ